VRLGELASDKEARAIKSQSGKLGKGAGKDNVLTWGDLTPSCEATLFERAD